MSNKAGTSSQCQTITEGENKKERQLNELFRLLKNHRDESLNAFGESKLDATFNVDQKNVTEFLQKNDMQIDVRNKKEESALQIAVKKAHVTIVKILIDCGANVNHKNQKKKTPLHLACKKDVKLIFKTEATSKDEVLEDRVKIVKMLVDCGAELDYVSSKEETPLQVCARQGFEEAAKVLIDNGAHINVADKDQWSPIHHFVRLNLDDTVKMLIEHGADLNLQNSVGRTPLLVACMWGCDRILKLLVECGADVNLMDNTGWTALHILALGSRIESVKVLINYGAKVDLVDHDGRTALHWTAIEGQTRIADILIKRGARYDLPDKYGFTAKKIALNGAYSKWKQLQIWNQ